MSKTVKTIAKIALPIAASFIPGIGPIAAAATGAALGAMDGGGVKGAVMGGVSGYLGAGAAKGIVGQAASIPAANVAGPAFYGSGIKGALTGGGLRAIGNTVAGTASGVASDPSKLLIGVGNQLMTEENANTSVEAAKIQSKSIDKALAANETINKPYTDLGANSAAEIARIQADPGAYVQNNPFYKSLADDAQRRLLANQAAKGKVGSGGTSAALQEQLLNLGNGLVQQQVGTLQNQVNTGANAASGVATNSINLNTDKGNVNAAGVVGQNNAYQSGYQNQINTLLALQGLQRAPIQVSPFNA